MLVRMDSNSNIADRNMKQAASRKQFSFFKYSACNYHAIQ